VTAVATQATSERPTTLKLPRRRRIRDLSVRSRIILYVLLVIVGIVFVFPSYWLFSSALKPSGDIYIYPPQWFPAEFHWQNFVSAWTAAPFTNFLINSVVVAIIATALKVALATMTAYAFTFVRFPGKKILFMFLLGTLMVPGTVTLLPNYLTSASLGWVNTYAGLIIPDIGSAFGTFLLRQHMMTLPREVFEAARVDGAGHLTIMRRLVVPMSRPIMITVTMVGLVDIWNSFIWPLVITNTVEMRTLPVGLLYLKSQEGYNDWGAIMAGSVIVALPMIVIFLLAQRYIVAGFTGGALKG